jgi:RimJ/RimL family protein N-acetyltransferase
LPIVLGPDLAGTRLRLRAPRVGDFRPFSRWYADPEVVRYWWMGDVPWARQPRIASVRLFLGAWFNRNAIVWTLESGGKPIGHCHIREIDRLNGHARTALLIGERSEQRKGLASEAIALRSDYAFRRLGLHKLTSSTRADNIAGRRMLERAGYRLVGTAREDAVVDGQHRDVLLFELLRSDHEQRRADDPR